MAVGAAPPLLLLLLALGAPAATLAAPGETVYTDYLNKHAAQEGTTKTLSGLQYNVLRSGDSDGPMPLAHTPCAVHYRGTLVDGREFDGTRRSFFGFPALFAPQGVIMGWTEAMQMMHEGDKWRLVISAHLAYGDRGAGDMIRPGAALVFELELVKVFEGTSEREYPGSGLLEYAPGPHPLLRTGPAPACVVAVRSQVILAQLVLQSRRAGADPDAGLFLRPDVDAPGRRCRVDLR